MVINIKLIALSQEKPVEVRQATLTLEKLYLRFFLDYDSEVPVDLEDLMLGWKEPRKSYYDIYVKKSSISAIEKFWNQKEEKWQLDIIVFGADDLKLLYNPRDESKADQVLSDLLAWWLD